MSQREVKLTAAECESFCGDLFEAEFGAYSFVKHGDGTATLRYSSEHPADAHDPLGKHARSRVKVNIKPTAAEEAIRGDLATQQQINEYVCWAIKEGRL